MSCSKGSILHLPPRSTGASGHRLQAWPVWAENQSHSWGKSGPTDDQGNPRNGTNNNWLPWGLLEKVLSPDPSSIGQEQPKVHQLRGHAREPMLWSLLRPNLWDFEQHLRCSLCSMCSGMLTDDSMEYWSS